MWPNTARGGQRTRKTSRLLQRISVDHRVCLGKPCIRGTRIWVSLIVDNLAAGVSEDETLQAYPTLERADIRTALAYATELTRERTVSVTSRKVG
ncbi:MAG: DUF433 domain-containing protein [Bacteroidales bacterium]|nr:DUF433 domain-containing protein [Bacteroidales bacterium]